MASSKFEGKSFQRIKMIFIKNGTIPKTTIYIIITYFYFSFLYLSLAGIIIVYTPNQDTNREKYFNQIIYQRRDADSGGK